MDLNLRLGLTVLMSMIVAIPRWFVGVRRGSKFKIVPSFVLSVVRGFLARFGALFVPFTCDCREISKYRPVCVYEKLDRCIDDFVDCLRVVADAGIKVVQLHTEYQLPLWFDEEFVQRYVEAVKKCLDRVSSYGVKRLVVEVHPGFSDVYRSKDLTVIARGIVSLAEKVFDYVKGIGIEFELSVESRSSSSTVDRRAQAASTLEELEKLRSLIEGELKRRNLSMRVLAVLDPPQLAKAYMRLYGIRPPKTIDYTLQQIVRYIDRFPRAIGELHIHWYRDEHNLKDPHRVPSREIWKKLFKPIIEISKNRGIELMIVPEISPVRTRAEDYIEILKIIESVYR